MKKPPPTLRDRIIANVPVIMDLIGNDLLPDSLGGERDPRPGVVLKIKAIADLKTTPRFAALRAFEQVEKDVRRLESDIAKLPPSVRRHIELEIKGLDAARQASDRASGRTEVKRKMMAAEAAFDLIADHGTTGVSLYPDGPYVALAGLLYLIATGKRANLRKSCTQHFDDLEEEAGVNLRLDSRPRPPRPPPFYRGQPTPLPDWVLNYVPAKKKPRNWPPLEEVVDGVLRVGSKR